MVQELHVLRCFSCNIFQLQIVKKVKKWQCKICNEKQSVQKVYFQGSGQECRLQVQRMNLKKHIRDEEEFEKLKTRVGIIEEKEEEEDDEKPLITESKWTKYIVEEITNEKEMEKEKLNAVRNTDESQFSDSNPLGENNILPESEIENCKSENLFCYDRNLSFHLRSRNNENSDENDFREIEINFLEERKNEKRKFEDDEEFDSDYFSSKRTRFNEHSLERKKNLRDIIKSNRKENGKLFDENKSAEEDSETNKYSVYEETISCKYNLKKKTVFQSDLDDFDDTFDL